MTNAVSDVSDLECEVRQLKKELNNLKFRLCDEQDEINRISGLWRVDIQKFMKVGNQLELEALQREILKEKK